MRQILAPVLLAVGLLFSGLVLEGCGGSNGVGSACAADKKCADGLVCANGSCASCEGGALGCACPTGGSCATGLVCSSDNTCQMAACHQGQEGCGCLSDGTCPGATGGPALTCTSGMCVKADCTTGARGCACRADGTCNTDLICYNGLCARDYGGGPESLTPPASPKCYTPCSANLVDATSGTVRVCSPEGLMEGCVGGRVCTNGTCLPPASGKSAVTAPACEAPTDCPTFQTCIGFPTGTCFSNCETNSDCSGERRCHRKVCRLPCSAGDKSCPTGTFCDTADGANGHCMPVAAPEGMPQRQVLGDYSLDVSAAEFTNNKVSATFKIINNSSTPQAFTIKKLEHTEYTTNGAVRVDTNAMPWVKIGAGSTAAAQVQDLTATAPANGELVVTIDGALNSTLSRWDGVLEISSKELGRRTFNLTYASRPDGRWSGKMYYFANFNDVGLNTWLNANRSPATLPGVRNAFIQKWAEFKGAAMTLREWQAVLTATQTGSWKFDNVKSKCPSVGQPDPDKGCYLYDNTAGMALYSTSLATFPIPTGLVELPVTMNLRTTSASSPSSLDGKVLSSATLHYAGDPKVTVKFRTDPTGCTSNLNGTCIMLLDDFHSDVVVGGRYQTTSGDTSCNKAPGSNFKLLNTPWLVPGFTEGSTVDPQTNLRYRYECRDQLFPYGNAPALYGANASFAASNPVPDGRSRKRVVELIDGAMINGSDMMVIFRERFQSFMGPSDGDFSAYGYMILSREPSTSLKPADFAGSVQSDSRLEPNIDTLACKPEVLSKVLSGALTSATAQQAVRGLIDGVVPIGAPPVPLDGTSTEKVHYLCADTGLFNGGKDLGAKVACPPGSDVTFFTVQNRTDAQMAAEGCNANGSCRNTLNAWVANKTYSARLNPSWQCKNSAQVYCDSDRLDLRPAKNFYPVTETRVAFVPIRQEIESAFRYKTRFRNRSGTSVGFAPTTCVPNSDAVPYCYDPPSIETIRNRVDCAVSIYSNPTLRAGLDLATVNMVQGYLGENFSYTEEFRSGEPLPFIHDGFERLNAELLIMLGDESYTKAFASRFDLSGSALVSFQGALFEPNGINLAGAAGYEMYNLYLASQYYQTTLDRFYTHGPRLLALINELQALPQNPAQRIVSSYFTRLIRASTQKARAASEIAKRYQSFNRPDLARVVAERAYTAAYLESVVLSRMMLRLVNFSNPQDRAQIVKEAELASLGYRSALLEMRDFYKDITDKINFFGFAPDYIPFPALEASDSNAVAKSLTLARSKMSTALDKENLALSSNRSFETDAASFQNELAKVRNTYENQLAELCGTFEASDGRIYPAIPKYAPLSPITARMGDPCGFVGKGALHEAMANAEIAGVDFKIILEAQRQTDGKIASEQDRVSKQCNLQNKIALENYKVAKTNDTLAFAASEARVVINGLQRLADNASKLALFTKCSIIAGTAAGGDCPTAVVAAGIFAGVSAALEVGTAITEGIIVGLELKIAQNQTEQAYWEGLQDCEFSKIESEKVVKDLLLETRQHQLEALRGDYNLRLAFSNIQKLRHQATRLMAEQSETEQLEINVEAARNDPNVRIYKNDDILTADRTFRDAVREAYRATKVFEYYTSQSYSHLNDLFLVRMIGHGDITLESYVTALENEFTNFQEQFGLPDLRVAVVSLRDDVLKIPHLADDGRALGESERIALFRAQLKDTTRLNEQGYLAFPFATKVSDLSPLTRNHKVSYLQAEIVGSDVGDPVGRVYLKQKGTSVVSSLFGPDNFFALPERTAVLNPFFNGDSVFDPAVYQSGRLKDRPFVNTNWELVVNQKDEAANKDINLQSLSDIRLFIYYTDFTKL